MSFVVGGGSVKFGISVTGYNEVLAAIDGIIKGLPTVSIQTNRDSAIFFVKQARTRVHKITHNLEKSIRVEPVVTPVAAIVSANMPYAQKEETRKGNRRTAPYTPHPYMEPSALETVAEMPKIGTKYTNILLSKYKTR